MAAIVSHHGVIEEEGEGVAIMGWWGKHA